MCEVLRDKCRYVIFHLSRIPYVYLLLSLSQITVIKSYNRSKTHLSIRKRSIEETKLTWINYNEINFIFIDKGLGAA